MCLSSLSRGSESADYSTPSTTLNIRVVCPRYQSGCVPFRDVGLSDRQNTGEAARVDEEFLKGWVRERGVSKKNDSLQQPPGGGAHHPERF